MPGTGADSPSDGARSPEQLRVMAARARRLSRDLSIDGDRTSFLDLADELEKQAIEAEKQHNPAKQVLAARDSDSRGSQASGC